MTEPRSATALAHAKLNLTLRVTGVRDDGMHLLDSLMCSISLTDRVTLTERSDDVVTVESIGADIGPDFANLALKAAKLFQEEFGGAGYDIVLEKEIPAGAGLGGGSADAAATLRLARHITGWEMSDAALAEIGTELGADIPFCLGGGLAQVSGIGDVLQPVEMHDALYDAVVVLGIPNFAMPTGDVYAAWDRNPATGTRDVVPACLTQVADRFVNDLEPPAEELVPELHSLRAALSTAIGSPARMTGSGSGIFGFARSMREANKAARRVADSFAAVLLCRPVRSGVEILD